MEGAALLADLLQHLAAHGIEGGHRQDQPLADVGGQRPQIIGGAAGFGKALGHLFLGGGLILCNLGQIPLGEGGVAILIPGGQGGGLPRLQLEVKVHPHPGSLFAVELGKVPQHPLGGDHILLLADAKHGFVDFIIKIAGCEPAAGKDRPQGIKVHRAALHGVFHRGDRRSHIFGALHPPLDLQGMDPAVPQFRHPARVRSLRERPYSAPPLAWKGRRQGWAHRPRFPLRSPIIELK